MPRLLNFLNPSYLLSRLQAPSISSGPGKTLKITKERRRRVEAMMDLLSQAEGEGCEQVWAFKGKMRMVSYKYCGRVWQLIPSSHLKESSRI